MDVNTALSEIREAVVTYNSTTDEETANDAAARVVERFEAIDGWLSRGGFLPSPWAGACPTDRDSGAEIS